RRALAWALVQATRLHRTWTRQPTARVSPHPGEYCQSGVSSRALRFAGSAESSPCPLLRRRARAEHALSSARPGLIANRSCAPDDTAQPTARMTVASLAPD